jgi:hypothetical protein
MDRQRFDSLTRAMAIGKSRRDMLKLLVGGAAGVAVAATVVDEAAALCHGNSCGSDGDCCDSAPFCSGGVCAEQMAAPAATEAPAEETTAVTTAPDAGVGPGDSDSNAWLGIAAAGGAAALVGAKFLRKQHESADEKA